MPKTKGLTKRYRFSQEKLEVVPKGKGLTKRYRFSHKQLEVVPKGKGLAKREVQPCKNKGQIGKGLVGRVKMQINNVTRSLGQLGNQGDQIGGQ